MKQWQPNRWVWMAAAILAAGHLGAFAAAASLAGRYERLYLEAKARAEQQPTNSEAAWILSRACFDRNEFSTNSIQRAQIAREGVAAARVSITLGSNAAPAYYYLGMNLGRLADATRTLGGLKLVAEMERTFNKVLALDPLYDYAGGDRCLGLLYRDAPGWPISVGNRGKARQHLERACRLAPEYPDNQLNLMEAWQKWGEKDRLSSQLGRVQEIMKQARLSLTGEAWAMSWEDWDRRWKAVRGNR
jgi:tetratricopeptide (TPR) repeat protein